MSGICQIEANPDIAGIGVRVSIYAQAALTLLNLGIAVADGKVTARERKVLQEVLRNLQLTSCALLASAFVQAGLGKLSTYHVLIVLHLSWINSITAMAFCAQEVLVYLLPGEHDSDFIEGSAYFYAIFQVCLTSTLGIWTWARLARPAETPGACHVTTMFSLFTHPYISTNPKLRVASIVVYSLFTIPLANIFILFCAILILGGVVAGLVFSLTVCIAYIIYSIFYIPLNLIMPRIRTRIQDCLRILRRHDITESRAWLTASYATILLIIIFLVFDVESMIRENKDLLQASEKDWTFGQTLAIILLYPSALEIYKQARAWYKDEYKAGDVGAGKYVDVGIGSDETSLKRRNTT